MLPQLNDRSKAIFSAVVESYLETGDPVGSRTLSRVTGLDLSPATIRNVMADLEDAGLLAAPHTSAGRLPTDMGLKLFVDGLMEIGNVTTEERESLEGHCKASGGTFDGLMTEASTALSGLTRHAGLVLAPKTETPLRHIELVPLNPGRALVVMVTESGVVENRVIETSADLPPSSLVQASNYLSARLVGRTLAEAQAEIEAELASHRAELDELSAKVVEQGLAVWSGTEDQGGQLIIRGQANLLDDVTAMADLEKIRTLFDALEAKETSSKLLTLAESGEGVQIFIGSETELFGLSGCSMIVGPFRDSRQQIVGAVGVIGPTRMNYGRIIPMVDYTSQLIGRLLT
ncbi:MAG: heat-inducible transcriptional repressor HrcA [Magnetovibrionaceae bacterium]